MTDLTAIAAGRLYAVLGLGRSGLATLRALRDAGAAARAWDDAPTARAEAEATGFTLTDLSATGLGGCEALILSPGIPHTHPAPHPVASMAKAAGLPIIGDVELFGAAERPAWKIGITGTNGKSTTTALIGHILERTRAPLAVGGNLGTAVLSFPPLGPSGTAVLEMSSYQLELCPTLAFDVAVLLNITPDHLDRHGGMDGYVAAKELIFRAGPPRPTVAVIGVDDEICRALHDRLYRDRYRRDLNRIVPISAERLLLDGISAPDGVLLDGLEGRDGRPDPQPVLDLRDVPTLPGRHNWQNICAAYAACRLSGLAPEEIAARIRTYPGLAHRLELVATRGDVRFVNDSKATNADAAGKALASYDEIYWIAGGEPKEGGLAGLEDLLHPVRAAFLIGAAEAAFSEWLGGRVPAIHRCGTLDRAVARAATQAAADAAAGRVARPVVLLSPACASFDQFRSFEHRGDVFRDLVRGLPG